MPLEAAEMALLRIIHASELPDPGALIEKLMSGEAVAATPQPQAASAAADAGGAMLKAPPTFVGLVDLLATKGKPHLAQQLHDYVGLIRYEPPLLAVRPLKPMSGDLVRDLVAGLKSITGETWEVSASDEPAQPSLLEQEKMQAERLRQSVLETPIVKAAFETFPDAELINHNISEQRSA
jgi:DNA polymerase-3 subunit gamma/tau